MMLAVPDPFLRVGSGYARLLEWREGQGELFRAAKVVNANIVHPRAS